MTQNLAKHINNESKPRNWTYKPVEVPELLRFYGALVLLEATYGNNTRDLKKHFAVIKKSIGGSFTMGVDRFGALKRAFYVSSEQLQLFAEEINSAAWGHVVFASVKQVTADEGVIGYQPSKEKKAIAEAKGDPIPVVYMPRKPHPNGLEFMLLMTFIRHSGYDLPYMLDILPHLAAQDCNPPDIIKQFVERYPQVEPPPHLVTDAGFPTPDLVNFLIDHGWTFTSSTPSKMWTNVWNVLSQGLHHHSWRCAQHESGIIASCHLNMNDKNEPSYQYVLTNAAVPVESNVNPSVENPLATVTHQTIHDQPSIPVYVQADLEKMTVLQLKAICKQYNIKQGKVKASTIQHIMTRSQSMNTNISAIKSMVDQLQAPPQSDSALVHNFYKDYFNHVDQTDRRWNSVEEHHANHNWRAKLLQAMFRYAVINAWTHATKREYQTWAAWHEQLGHELANYDL
jgi:hypothetical protein